MIDVKVRNGEPVGKALRRLKKKMDNEGILQTLNDKRYFKKPSLIKKEKKKKRK